MYDLLSRIEGGLVIPSVALPVEVLFWRKGKEPVAAFAVPRVPRCHVQVPETLANLHIFPVRSCVIQLTLLLVFLQKYKYVKKVEWQVS